jgi:small-conductance mechanosensitive channel
MNFQEILDKTLFKTDNFSITVSEVLLGLLILIVTRVLLLVLKRLFVRKIYTLDRVDKGKSQSLFQLIRYVAWILSIMIVLEVVGIKITFLLAGSAALLVGLGLGLQQIFKDIVSGLFLLFEANIKVNDVVELDEEIGRVKDITFRTTKIETRDNIIVIIPNSRFISENVINWSHINKTTRFSVDVGVAYGSDVRLVKEVLLSCAAAHKQLVKHPKPFVRFLDFGNSSLDFQLFFWTDYAFEVENIKSDLRFDIDDKFRKNNIQIPFPQRDVHIRTQPQ